MLKTILELRGEKRFRRQRNAGQSMDTSAKGATVDDPVDIKDYNAAKSTFRKMSVKSSYNRQFGDRPQDEEAFQIVKKKRFSELDFSSILKPTPNAYIERWIINDSDEEFTSRVFFTLRAMYTIVRGKSNFETTNRAQYIDAPKYVASQPPRFDLFEKHQNATLRATAASFSLQKKKTALENSKGQYQPSSSEMLKKFKYDPLMDPKGTRHDDLKGDKGLVYFLNPRDASYTHYSGYFAGK